MREHGQLQFQLLRLYNVSFAMPVHGQWLGLYLAQIVMLLPIRQFLEQHQNQHVPCVIKDYSHRSPGLHLHRSALYGLVQPVGLENIMILLALCALIVMLGLGRLLIKLSIYQHVCHAKLVRGVVW